MVLHIVVEVFVELVCVPEWFVVGSEVWFVAVDVDVDVVVDFDVVVVDVAAAEVLVSRKMERICQVHKNPMEVLSKSPLHRWNYLSPDRKQFEI